MLTDFKMWLWELAKKQTVLAEFCGMDQADNYDNSSREARTEELACGKRNGF